MKRDRWSSRTKRGTQDPEADLFESLDETQKMYSSVCALNYDDVKIEIQGVKSRHY